MSDQHIWTAVDDYIEQHLIPDNPVLQQTLAHTAKRGFPHHLHIAPNQGVFLQILIQMRQCRRILELGTFAAYSTICMAQALPDDGYILTIENRETHWQLAQENIQNAGFSDIIDCRLGRAEQILANLPPQTPAFDFIFIDADKQNYPKYLQMSLQHAQSGTVIVLDNVIRAAEIINEENHKPSITGLRQVFDDFSQYEQLQAYTALQTVGCKGYDGFAIAMVK